MSQYCVPLEYPAPDAPAFIRCLMGEEIPDKPPMVAYLVDEVLMRPILTEMMGREWVPVQSGDTTATASAQIAGETADWDNFIEFWYRMGCDSVGRMNRRGQRI